MSGREPIDMELDLYDPPEPDRGEIESAELAVTDDVLVKVFALGPGAELTPHEHSGTTNVFHIVEGTVTVIQGDSEEPIDAPGVVLHGKGVGHGARNDTDAVAILTASLCPLPN